MFTLELMSLLKIPLSLTLAYACHYCGTSPNKPSSDVEVSKYRQSYGGRSISESILASIGPFIKICMWAESALEIVCTAFHYLSQDCTIQPKPFGPITSSTLVPIHPLDHCRTTISPKYMTAWVLIMSAAIIRRECYRSLGHMFTFDLSIKNGHTLVQRGPYAIVRHPAYAAFLLLNFGIILLHSSGEYPGILGKATSPQAYYDGIVIIASLWGFLSLARRANVEDKVLMEEFGAEWSVWSAKVPYKFIPLIW